jgi:lysophospholipid acyltransferase (LPLAT)-like uncharacterized protein
VSEARRVVVLDWKLRWAIRLGWVLLRALGATWRLRIVGRASLDTRAPASEPVIYCLWHGQILPILWGHRPRTGVVVSEHKDGEIITRVLERFGMFGVRGSSSRGGTRALLEAAQVVRAGEDMAFTPDGPRGPRHSFAPGALILAHRAEVPLVPLVASVDRAWRLGSWDGFEIPKPFARITVLYDTPRRVVADSPREAAAQSGHFAQLMHDALARADALAKETRD